MPDERWTRKFEIARRNAEAAKERNQPQRLTKRERQLRDQAERRRIERERQIKERQQGMPPEELERKREERRQQRRNAARKKKQGKDQKDQA